jgi:hypothetical protein
MSVYAASAAECAGNGGMRGGNYIFTNDGTAVIGNTGVALGSETVANTDGSIVIDYTPNAITACVETPQTVDIYRVIKLSASGSCTWTVPAGVTTIDLFAVGGGGAGGSNGGSGGGGGAAITRTALLVTASTSLTVKIGYGGGASFTDGWVGGNGDSTTISFPSGLFLAANGGSMGVKGDGTNAKVGGLGGTAVNGGFAGGAGGASATTVNSRGLVGKTGVSNYFAGTVAEFGGGGGGGMHKNACSTLDGQLGSSGGAAGASCNSNVNSAGGSALAETGGGGGGGGFGTSGNTLGGKGGSGVVYVRYAINAADAFPASLSSALAGRYSPGDLQLLDSTRKGWIDSSGTNASVSNADITSTGLSILNQGVTDGGVTTGSTKSLLAVRGTSSSQITLQNLNVGYTLFHVARYVASGTNARIFTARDANWLSGFYYGVRETHHGAWLTDDARIINTQWLLSTDQAVSYRANGIDVADNDNSIGTQQTSAANFGINNYVSGDRSDFQVSDVIIFNRELSVGEIRLMEIYLSRLNGLTLSPYFNTSETDTTNTITATYSYLFMQQDARNNLNDTFTVEAWLRPDAACNTTVCTYFAREGSVRLVVRNGQYEFILHGDGGWEWVPTGVPIKSGEWQHVAISKTLRGNRGDSVKLYINGQLAYSKAGSPYRTATTASTNSDASTLTQVTTWSYIGVISNGGERWRGDIDEFKIWKVARTQSEIQADMHSNDASSPLMQAYFDMNFVPGTRNNEFKIPNLAYGGHARSDLFNWTADTLSFTDVKEVSNTGPYTVIRFPRTYITQSGGWRSPESITAVNYLIAAGGGAGGRGDATAHEAGAGGAGGVLTGVTSISSNTTYPVVVGAGGLGIGENPTSGGNSSALSITTIGGGHGGFALGAGASGGSGGGGTHNRSAGGAGTAGQGFAGVTPTGSSAGGGGGGATATGVNGVGGIGLSSSISGSSVVYGDGGGAGYVYTGNVIGSLGGSGNGGRGSTSYGVAASNGVANTGSGGGGAWANTSTIKGGNGGSGVVIVRYITALRPTYTKPVNAFLNVGMTETFTTNVAQDSATAVLTRTFRWESTTAGAGGPFTTIKEGTGANNAFFAWVPTDTSTSGSQYLYRLIVTDSDTAGLFISDSSTAFAVINRTLTMTGQSSISKSIGVSRSEIFTVDGGTSTFRYTLSPDSTFFSLDTSTATSPRLQIADTATVGTYLETITVTDSVSASVTIPLTIKVSPPPSFSADAEQVDSGTVLYLDAGNSASYPRTGTSWSDLSGRGLSGNLTANLGSKIISSSINTCTTPNFSPDGNGSFNFISSSRTCAYVADLGTLTSYTVDTWIKRSGAQTANSAIFTTPYSGSGKQINIALRWTSATQIIAGIYTGSDPWIYSAAVTIDDNTWTNLVVTFSGNALTLIKNNIATTSTTGVSVSWNPANTDSGLLLGRRWDGDSDWFTGSIASLRIYNRVLTSAELTQNYNATRGKFEGTSNKFRVAGKYGTTVNETFTVTAGSETLTASFTSNAIAGLRWDTSTVRSLKVEIQDSLLPNTYTDTVTVTDIYGVSSRIPLTFVVSKADTITVTAGPATTQVFNNQQAASLPNFEISGLVLSDTGTVLRNYTGIDWTKPCSQGGGCEVGDTGPGGGTIFYISPTVINAATGISAGGRYLEVAPLNWSGLSVESTTAWAKVQTSVINTSSAIGSGAENTRLINSALGTNALAAKIAADLSFPSSGAKTDWFLPSTLELKEMYDALYAPNLAGNLSIRNYWSSTQGTNTAQADTYWFGDGGLVSTTDKLNSFTLRPIRAYSPDTITVTTVPTNVDSYTVTVDTVTLTSGSLSNYEGVIYQRSGLDITKARQDSLRINTYGATLGLPFRITILGGSGSGAVTETLVSGSTATGCAISGDTITSTSAGACNVQIKKAYSRNYLTETATATVYFLLWVVNQPSPAPGTGPNIAITGENTVTVDLDLAPMISSLSTYVATAGVTSITIYGVGFNNSDANFEVNFSRGVSGTGPIVNPAKTEITVTVPAGARTGKVTVKTSKGLALSELALTITP